MLSFLGFGDAGRSSSKRPDRLSSAERLLALVPGRHGADFFHGEHREEQMRESSLPGERFRFIEGEEQKTRLFAVERQEFSNDPGAGGSHAGVRLPVDLLLSPAHISLIQGRRLNSVHKV
jgi:hypothetical protein